MKLVTLFFLFITTAAVLSCTVVETTTGRAVHESDNASTWEEAAKESAMHDLPCKGRVSISPLSAGISGNGFLYADGCGRRVTYGMQSVGDNRYRLVLVSSVDLNHTAE